MKIVVNTFLNLLTKLGFDRAYIGKIGTLMGGTIGAQAIGLVSMLILTRLYIPAEFGVYAFFYTVSGLLALLSTAKYDQAVLMSENDTESATIAALAIAASISFALVVLAALLIFSDLVESTAVLKPLAGKFFYVSLAIATGGMMAALNALCIQRGQFRRLSTSRLFQAVIAAVIGVGLGFYGFGAEGLIAAFVGGQLAALAVLTTGHTKEVLSVSWRGIKQAAAKHVRFPRYMLPAELFNYSGTSFVPLVTPGFFGLEVLGHYNVGQRVAGLPIGIIGGAIGEVFRNNVSLQNTPRHEISALFDATAKRLFIVGLILVLPLALAGPWLFATVLGPNWKDAGVYMQILSPAILARLVASPLSAILLVAGRQWIDTALQLLFIGSALIGFFAGLYMQSFMVMLTVISGLHCIVYITYFIVSRNTSRVIASQ